MPMLVYCQLGLGKTFSEVRIEIDFLFMNMHDRSSDTGVVLEDTDNLISTNHKKCESHAWALMHIEGKLYFSDLIVAQER